MATKKNEANTKASFVLAKWMSSPPYYALLMRDNIGAADCGESQDGGAGRLAGSGSESTDGGTVSNTLRDNAKQSAWEHRSAVEDTGAQQ